MPTIAVHQTELLLYFTLLQLTIIVLAGRVGSTVAVRIGQAAAVGEIIVGILLGPSLFGLAAPELFHYAFRSSPPEPMQMLSQLGLILLMFQIGLEFDFSHLSEKRNRTAVTRVAALSLVLPFALGLAFGYLSAPVLSPQSSLTGSALFVATAFSITALPILGRILIDFGMTRAPLGVIAISAAAINDVIGWMMLALVTALTVANFDAGTFGLKVGLVVGFMLLCWFVVRPLMKRLVRRANPHDGRMPNNLLGMLLAAIFLAAMATYLLGIFAIFGGFMMGVILHDEHELVAGMEGAHRPVRAGVLPADLLHLHGPADEHWRSRQSGVVGMVRADAAAGDDRQVRRRVCRGPLVRPRPQRGKRARHPHEHAGADGAHHHQRRARPGRDFAKHVHDAGDHGDHQHGRHHAGAAPVAAADGVLAVRTLSTNRCAGGGGKRVHSQRAASLRATSSGSRNTKPMKSRVCIQVSSVLSRR